TSAAGERGSRATARSAALTPRRSHASCASSGAPAGASTYATWSTAARAASVCMAAVSWPAACSWAATKSPCCQSAWGAPAAAGGEPCARTRLAARRRHSVRQAPRSDPRRRPAPASEGERHPHADLAVVAPRAILAPVSAVEEGGFRRAREAVGEGVAQAGAHQAATVAPGVEPGDVEAGAGVGLVGGRQRGGEGVAGGGG